MIKRILLLFAVLLPLFLINSVPAAAFNIFGGVDCTKNANKSAICSNPETKDPLTGTGGLLFHIANIVSYAAGAAAVIILLVSSIRYITSGGDPGKAKKARDTILYALVGIIVIILARSLVIYVIVHLK